MRMSNLRPWLLLLLGLILTTGAWAQIPTGDLTGKVTDEQGSPLPGVTVTATSPALQGERVVITGANGFYKLALLPPGEYTLLYELDNFSSVSATVKISAAQESTSDITMKVGGVEEVIIVTSVDEKVSQTTTAAETITLDELDRLPVTRSLNAAVDLAAGTFRTGPNNGIVIQGAQSWENNWQLNGVTLNENLRGQPFTLYIEDAIQETTTMTSGVSAEYGRFTGGVVSAVTKSGGNQFNGSFRTSFDNESWIAKSPLDEEQTDKVNKTYEATFGGPILKDRIWFFLAGRNRETENTSNTARFNIPWVRPNKQDRYEAKLTFGFTNSHQLQVSGLSIDTSQRTSHGGLTSFTIVTDDGSVVDRKLPQDLLAAHYTGIVTSNFFVEAQYSERQFTFQGGGGMDQALDTGTPVWDLVDSYIYNESIFCGSCRDEERDNENAVAKASYFLETGGGGTHDLVFGYDTFNDIRAADNHQSPNDLMIWNFAGSVFDDGAKKVYPIFADGATLIYYLPILSPTKGTSFKTNSAFVNDRWQLNDQWSFNLGLRYDGNNGVNSTGEKVVNDSELSPRLGVTYRPSADGPWQFHASLGRYVGAIANTQANASSLAGVPAQFGYVYLGPEVNVGGGPPVGSPAALNTLYDWFLPICPNFESDPANCELLVDVDIPGGTTQIGDLKSTSADEWAIGFQRDLGRRGNIRVDYTHRDWNNFYASRIDQTTGQVDLPTGGQADLAIIENNDSILSRKYDGISALFRYNLLDNRLRLAGNYTYSHGKGNFEGETGGSGPVSSSLTEYPEYREARWNAPEGDLNTDQRHKFVAWAMYDLFNTKRQALNISVVQRYLSGSGYSASGSIDTRPYVTNPGYVTPPTSVTYFFSGRNDYKWDNETRTDLALNYSLKFGNRFEIFLQPQVLNVFNGQALLAGNTAVLTALSGAGRARGLVPFDPFTTAPAEGTHYLLGDKFGQANTEADYQTGLEYRFSVGFRF